MTTRTTLAVSTAALTLVFGLSGCAGMSDGERNVAVGAGVGAVAGSVLTGGSGVGAVGGAVAGGVIANEIEKRK